MGLIEGYTGIIGGWKRMETSILSGLHRDDMGNLGLRHNYTKSRRSNDKSA